MTITKIAIVTQYHNSFNYGGNLQAYALCKKISQLNYEVEQLSFKIEYTNTQGEKHSEENTFFTRLKISLGYRIKKLFLPQVRHSERAYMNYILPRQALISAFNQKCIPHCEKVYTNKNIAEALSEYDCFITGSDMVWYPYLYSPIMTLEFADGSVPKLSYAASIGVTGFEDDVKEKFRMFLKSYQAVSVREETSVSLLKDISPCKVEQVLDPVLLLPRKAWDEISGDRLIKEKYLFCFFLGENEMSRKAAVEYAEKHKLKLVSMPYLNGFYRRVDDFCSERLYAVSPTDFISLIKYSDAVFTDSFHACVFSFIYCKQFFVFRRNEFNEFSSRIYSFLNTIGMTERFCDSREKERDAYIENLKEADYSGNFEQFEKLKIKSETYLTENLKKAKERLIKNEK